MIVGTHADGKPSIRNRAGEIRWPRSTDRKHIERPSYRSALEFAARSLERLNTPMKYVAGDSEILA
jgi:hypothetical protein